MNINPFPNGWRLRRRVASACLALAGAFVVVPVHADLAKIQQSGTLKVALYQDLPPFSDSIGNQLAGVDVALAKALCKQMGLSASILPFSASDDGMSGDLRNMVWRGHYLGYGPADVMMHVPVDPIFMRQNDKALIFAPYHREMVVLAFDPQRIRQVDRFEDLSGLPTGAEAGSTGANALLTSAQGALRDKVKIYPKSADVLGALFSGEIAAAMVTRAEYENALKERGQSAERYPTTQLASPLLPSRGWVIGMAVKADQEALAQELQRALDTLRSSGELQNIFNQHGVSLVVP